MSLQTLIFTGIAIIFVIALLGALGVFGPVIPGQDAPKHDEVER